MDSQIFAILNANEKKSEILLKKFLKNGGDQTIRDDQYMTLYDHILLNKQFHLTDKLDPQYSIHYVILDLVTQGHFDEFEFLLNAYAPISEILRTCQSFPFNVLTHHYFASASKDADVQSHLSKLDTFPKLLHRLHFTLSSPFVQKFIDCGIFNEREFLELFSPLDSNSAPS